MNFKELSTAFKQSKAGSLFTKAKYFTIAKSPEILLIAGISGVIVSTVMACKASTKAADILEEQKQTLYQVHKVKDEVDEETYSEDDYKKDVTIAYTHTAMGFIKLYGPSVLIGGASIAALLWSHNILKQRNANLAAAYTVLSTQFGKYRKRVIEELGNEKDYEFRHGIKRGNVTRVDDETGEVKTEETFGTDEELDGYSDFSRFFDECSSYWRKNAEYNLFFLESQQDYANKLLALNGHLFLNEVYDMLDIPRTKAGQVVGWTYKEGCFVDFGIHRESLASKMFETGDERSILLDFNIDGVIINDI